MDIPVSLHLSFLAVVGRGWVGMGAGIGGWGTGGKFLVMMQQRLVLCTSEGMSDMVVEKGGAK